MNIFISGGCKNGKSYHAQELARDMAVQGGLPLYYLATILRPSSREPISARPSTAEPSADSRSSAAAFFSWTV